MATLRPSRQLEMDSVKLGLLILSLGYLHYSKVKQFWDIDMLTFQKELKIYAFMYWETPHMHLKE